MDTPFSSFTQSEHMGEFAEAFAQAQGHMANPVFDSTNPYFGTRYASLAAVRDAVIPALAAQGIAVIQTLVSDVERQIGGCTTTLYHKSGQFLSQTVCLPVPPPSSKKRGQGGMEEEPLNRKPNIQSYGSAFTYARRYSLMAIAGVVGDEDDDGEIATQREQPGQGQTHTTANGTFPVVKDAPPPKPTDTSRSIWRETLKIQSAVLSADWTLSDKEAKVLAGLNAAIRDANNDPFYADSKGLALADAALQWVDKLEAMSS